MPRHFVHGGADEAVVDTTGGLLQLKGPNVELFTGRGDILSPDIRYNRSTGLIKAQGGVQATLDLGAAILTAAGLSFLGLGTQPPTADWGVMVNEGRQYMLSGRWWIATFSGLAIFLTSMAFNLLGDGLRDALDPRLRGR